MKKIVVISGASSGFGKEYAHQVDRFYDIDEIWLIARSKDKLQKVALQLENSKGVVIDADLSTLEGLQIIRERLSQERDKIWIFMLINNAGFGSTGKFRDHNLSYSLNMVDLNIKAHLALTHLCLPFFAKGSQIINVASAAAFSPLPNFNVYGATKVFMLNFSYALAEELAEDDIHVMAVCPGPAKTNFFSDYQHFQKKGIMVAEARHVVKRSLRDLAKKKKLSVFGWQIQLVRILTGLTPRWLSCKIASYIKM